MGKDQTDPGIESRSFAALLASDLDWIVRLGYDLGGYILGCSRFATVA